MENKYLEKEDRKIIERLMPKSVRKNYKNGSKIKFTFDRVGLHDWLYKWGTHLELIITKNGKILFNNLDEIDNDRGTIAIPYLLYEPEEWRYSFEVL